MFDGANLGRISYLYVTYGHGPNTALVLTIYYLAHLSVWDQKLSMVFLSLSVNLSFMSSEKTIAKLMWMVYLPVTSALFVCENFNGLILISDMSCVNFY